MSYQAWNLLDIPSILPNYDRVNIFYSNPEYYTDCKHRETQTAKSTSSEHGEGGGTVQWSVKKDDFFPYSDGAHSFWTGYFTSRASFKRFERVSSGFLLAARQIQTLLTDATMFVPRGSSYSSPLYPLEDALGISQHHDSVSGTAKQHVADDYSYRLQTGLDIASRHVAWKLRRVMLDDDRELTNLVYCSLLNETICDVSEVRNRW